MELDCDGSAALRTIEETLLPSDAGTSRKHRKSERWIDADENAVLCGGAVIGSRRKHAILVNGVIPTINCPSGDFDAAVNSNSVKNTEQNPSLVSQGTVEPDSNAASSPLQPRSCLRAGPRFGRRCSDTPVSDLPRPPAARRSSETFSPVPRPPLRVSFHQSPVTAYLTQSDPLSLMGSPDVCEAYRRCCHSHRVAASPAVLAQLSGTPSDTLSLRGAALSEAAVDALEAVTRRRQWRRLDAGGALVSDAAAAALLQLVLHYDSAAWLSLAGAALGRHAWSVMSQLVKEAGVSSSLQWLSLEGVAVSEPAAAALARGLKGSQLRVLHLEGCRLHGRPLSLLAAGLRQSTGLKQLYLADNELGTGDGSLLGNALRYNVTLQLLDLRNNLLDADAADYLLRAIAEQPASPPVSGLVSLNLWNNRLDPAAAGAVSTLLTSHPSLETLNLGRNPVGDEMVAGVSSALVGATSAPLRRLGLQRCALTAACARHLARLVTEAALRRLDLRGNRLTAGGLRLLAEALQDGGTLQQVDLDRRDYCAGNGVVADAEASLEKDWSRAEEFGSDDFGGGVHGALRASESGSDSSVDSGQCERADSLEQLDSLGNSVTTPSDSLDSGAGGSATDTSPPPSVTSPDSDVTTLLSSISALCAANRHNKPATGPEPTSPIADAFTEPPAPAGRGDRLLRRLSAALRKVSLTCETPAPPAPPQPRSPVSPSLAVPVPRPRRLVSPAPSPSVSPLSSPAGRFRVFRVGSAEVPGTPPLPRGLLRPSGSAGGEHWSPSPSPEPSLSSDQSAGSPLMTSLPGRVMTVSLAESSSALSSATTAPAAADGGGAGVGDLGGTGVGDLGGAGVAVGAGAGVADGGGAGVATLSVPGEKEWERAAPSPGVRRRSFRVTPVRETAGPA